MQHLTRSFKFCPYAWRSSADYLLFIKEISIKFSRWNVTMSPNEPLPCSTGNSLHLCLLAENGTESFSPMSAWLQLLQMFCVKVSFQSWFSLRSVVSSSHVNNDVVGWRSCAMAHQLRSTSVFLLRGVNLLWYLHARSCALLIQQCVFAGFWCDLEKQKSGLFQTGFISLTLLHSHLVVVVLPLLVFTFVVLFSDSFCWYVSLAHECVCLPMPVCVCAFSDSCSCVDVFLLLDRWEGHAGWWVYLWPFPLPAAALWRTQLR